MAVEAAVTCGVSSTSCEAMNAKQLERIRYNLAWRGWIYASDLDALMEERKMARDCEAFNVLLGGTRSTEDLFAYLQAEAKRITESGEAFISIEGTEKAGKVVAKWKSWELQAAYAVVGRIATVIVTYKPYLLKCATIEEEIRKAAAGLEVVAGTPLLAVLEAIFADLEDGQ